MKTKIIQVFLLTIMTLMLVNAHSQQKSAGTPEQRAEKLTGWMKTNLQLNDNQATQVHDINFKYANKNEQLKNSTASKRQKLQTLKADDQAKDAELKAILTPEQFTTYQTKKEELKKEMKKKMKEKKG
jgi:Spy/CpxP family protein refolding chaperone